jgi:hypothetical protein
MKANLANELAFIGDMPMMSECERYGMSWGCDENCPVWSRGECDCEDSKRLLGGKK